VVLLLEGEIDVATGPLLEDAIDWAAGLVPGVSIVVDMAGVEFLDSAGTHALTRATKRARSGGGGVAVRNPRPMACRLFDILGLESVLTIEPVMPFAPGMTRAAEVFGRWIWLGHPTRGPHCFLRLRPLGLL